MPVLSPWRLVCKTGLRQVRDACRIGDTLFVGGERKGRYSDPLLDYAETPIADGAALWSYDLTAGAGGDAVEVSACTIEDANCLVSINGVLYVGGWKGEWSYYDPGNSGGGAYREPGTVTLKKGSLWAMSAEGVWAEAGLEVGIPSGHTDRQIVDGEGCTRVDEIIGLFWWDNALWISTTTGSYRLGLDGSLTGTRWESKHAPMDTLDGSLCSAHKGTVYWRVWHPVGSSGNGYYRYHSVTGWVCTQRSEFGWSQDLSVTGDPDSPYVENPLALRRVQGALCGVHASVVDHDSTDRMVYGGPGWFWSKELTHNYAITYGALLGIHGEWAKRDIALSVADVSDGCNVWEVPPGAGYAKKLTAYPMRPTIGLALEPWVSDRIGERLWIAEGYPQLGVNNAIIHVWPWAGAERLFPAPLTADIPPTHDTDYRAVWYDGYVDGQPVFTEGTIRSFADCYIITALKRSVGRLYAGLVDRLVQDIVPLSEALGSSWQTGWYEAELGSGCPGVYAYLRYEGPGLLLDLPRTHPVVAVPTDDTEAWVYQVSTAAFRALVSHDSRWCAVSGSDGWTYEWWPSGRLQERDEVAGAIISVVSDGGVLFLGRDGAIDRGTSSVGPWETDTFASRACESLAVHGSAPHCALVGATDTQIKEWSADAWNAVATLTGAYSVLCEHGTTLYAFGTGTGAYYFDAGHVTGSGTTVTGMGTTETILSAYSDGTTMWVGTDLGRVLKLSSGTWSVVTVTGVPSGAGITALLYWQERLWIGCSDTNGLVSQLVDVTMAAGGAIYAVGDEGDRTVLALTPGTGAVETFTLGEYDNAIMLLDTYGSERIIYSRVLTSRQQGQKMQHIQGHYDGTGGWVSDRWVYGFDAAFWPDSQPPSDAMQAVFPWIPTGVGNIVLGHHWEQEEWWGAPLVLVADEVEGNAFWYAAAQEDAAYGRSASMLYPSWAMPDAICVRSDTHPPQSDVDFWVTFHPTSLDLKDWQPVEAGLYTEVFKNAMKNVSLTYRIAMRMTVGTEEPGFSSKLKVRKW